MTDNDLFTKAAAARWLGVTPQAVHERIKAGKLTPVVVRGDSMVTRAALDAWKQERKDRAQLLTGEPK